MSQQPTEAAKLPSIAEVTAILEMCDKHDLPVAELPGLWDKFQKLEQVERRINIQNGNMDREISRLRELTNELDAQLRDEKLNTASLEANNGSLLAHISELQELLEAAERSTRVDDLEDLVSHYRCGMAGMKEIADNPHFSNELRLQLIRNCLYVFEPEHKACPDDCKGVNNAGGCACA
ncbi:hypothetical protein IAJ44_004232 [Salmonella enterica]|nr:hypothetical protein [Salmonella enterica]